jgi:hypothetical protein
MNEHNTEEEKEIDEIVPLLQNAYQIFNNTMTNHEENSEKGDWHFVRKKKGAYNQHR